MQVANQLGVYGNIRNLKDGSVSGVIQGSAQQIQEMMDYLKRGPQFAMVQSLQINEISAINVTCFEILR
ncbi:acylphosphatase [bacterium]|nr:acylphosphatase [bacterium]